MGSYVASARLRPEPSEVEPDWAPEALELAGYSRDFGLKSAFEDMLDRMLEAEQRVSELQDEGGADD